MQLARSLPQCRARMPRRTRTSELQRPGGLHDRILTCGSDPRTPKPPSPQITPPIASRSTSNNGKEPAHLPPEGRGRSLAMQGVICASRILRYKGAGRGCEVTESSLFPRGFNADSNHAHPLLYSLRRRSGHIPDMWDQHCLLLCV